MERLPERLAEKQMCCRHIYFLKLTHLFKAGNQMSKMHVTLSNKRPMWRRGRSQQLCAGTLCWNSGSDKVSQVNKETKFYFVLLLAGLYTLETNLLEGYSC